MLMDWASLLDWAHGTHGLAPSQGLLGLGGALGVDDVLPDLPRCCMHIPHPGPAFPRPALWPVFRSFALSLFCPVFRSFGLLMSTRLVGTEMVQRL